MNGTVVEAFAPAYRSGLRTCPPLTMSESPSGLAQALPAIELRPAPDHNSV